MQQIKERGALPMIDRGDIRQAIKPLQQYLGFTAGRWLWSVRRHKAGSLIANSKKRAERSERLMYEQVTAIISALVICIIVCLSWAVNHYRDNAIAYKAQRQKCQRTEAGERGSADMQMRQRDVAALDYLHEGVS